MESGSTKKIQNYIFVYKFVFKTDVLGQMEQLETEMKESTKATDPTLFWSTRAQIDQKIQVTPSYVLSLTV